ncbi:alpha/beta hydrolase fold domain-containing protein [Altererythrobacter buctensis]|uniref:Alpha/beta hydrolase fold domain-containing protein n=2 Tax=Alteraurantiacibacter buctensis TaxID=1503981 RepID=A0A844Z3D0_9SPHN|nr:alpha/beta hydrolase fold domain-containing protein [Alteraurantiacibacter buctensis]
MKHTLRLVASGCALASASLVMQSAMAQSGPPVMAEAEAPDQRNAIPLYTEALPPMQGQHAQENWGTFDRDYLVVRNVTQPTITPFLPHPSQATGAAVIVAPGGGFRLLAIDAEGEMVARWLAAHGVAAFLLKYRVMPTPVDPQEFARQGEPRPQVRDGVPVRPPAFQPAIDDGVAAVRWVRSRAEGMHVDPHRVGMIGFSAGAMTTLSVAQAQAEGAEPDFIGLIYGPMMQAEVPHKPPPLFAALATDDPLFGNNGTGLLDAWRAAGGKIEFHLYQAGGHGFGIRPVGTTATLWPGQFLAWLESNGLLEDRD